MQPEFGNYSHQSWLTSLVDNAVADDDHGVDSAGGVEDDACC
ncbi:hypothetical protein R3Q08_30880 [Rhodococcus erythropolis]|nr:hypothetical protein [Rhodococcus erythropolis]MDV6212669.1 hypothetical protein [Rhodococcus erythropolis]